MPSATSRPAQPLCKAETLRTTQPLAEAAAGWPRPAGQGRIPDGYRVQGHIRGAAGERRRQAASAVQHRARLPAERVAGLGLDAEVPQMGAGLDDVGRTGGVRVHHALGVVARANCHTAPTQARRGRRRRCASTRCRGGTRLRRLRGRCLRSRRRRCSVASLLEPKW